MDVPTIRSVSDNQSDFHDSSLIDLQLDPVKETVRVVLSTPDENDNQRLWLIEFKGVVRLEMETLGDGRAGHVPPEIYDVFFVERGERYQRWITRLRDQLGDPEPIVYLVVLASSYLRGWGEREELEGIEIVCRGFRVRPAPRRFRGQEFSTPRIPGDPKDD